MLSRPFRAKLPPAARRVRRPARSKLLRIELLEGRLAPAGLVAAYGFEEGVGGTVGDSSGNLNSGTIANASWSTAGQFGNALSFNGSNALVTVNDADSLDLTTGMTLEAWVRPTVVTSAWRDVIYKGVNDIYYLEATSTSQGRPATGGTYASNDLFGPSVLAVNTWSHLAATYDGATMRLYVDGVQVASRAQTGPIATSTGALTIGGDDFFGQYFAGLIDEVRIYNRALTDIEIQADMNSPVGNPPDDDEPPTVSLLTPNNGATLSHVTILSATASDNLSISEVEFFVNAVSVGGDSDAPYSVAWNSTLVANGPHVVTAVARDGSGNETTSSLVNVTVVNPAFVNEIVVPGIFDATTIAFLPDGRMLVGELTNKVLMVQAGANQPDPQPLLDLDYTHQFDEQGLMDIAIDPTFSQNGYFYVYYTKGFPGAQNHNRLSRFTLSGNAVVPGSEFVLWQDDLVARNEHHAGAIAFGNDGKIYFTTGDEFIASSSQELTNFWGKVLRINPDGSIPLDNPFYDGAGPNKDAIWAYGLRNPFRMSIDPVTGLMYIGDVGGNINSTAIEEINLGVRGANYGWPLEEGDGGVPGTTAPIYSYPHSGRDASVTGGFVYRGSQFPSEYYGSYFFADYVQNTIKRLTFDAQGNVDNVANFWPANGSTDTTLVGDPVKLIQGPDGSLYYVDLGFNDQHVPNEAAIRRIRYIVGNQPPIVMATGNPTAGAPPLTVEFSSVGSFDPEGLELTYEWDFGDGSTSTQANPTHVYTSAGPYVATLTASDGEDSTLSSNIAITVGTLPTPTILGPADGSLFRAGDMIAFAGSATDFEDGVLPASAFSWEIRFRHEGHIHPLGIFSNTQSGVLNIPTSGHDFQGFTRYEIVLFVTDTTGLTATTSVTVYPDKVDLNFDSIPSGLTIQIDGISKQTPFVLDDLIGFHHTITAPDQASGGSTYIFLGWSDGGAQSHEIVVPPSDQSYVATFEATQSSGLVAAYGFEEGVGGTVGDSSGNLNSGTIANASWSTAGQFGNALSFNGSNALVTVNDADSLDLTTGMTLEAWVRPTVVTSAWRDVIYKGVNDIYYLEATSTSQGRPATGGTYASNNLFGPSALAVNTWSHLAATYDGTTMRLYVDGVQVASRAQTGPIATSTGALTIGGDDFFGQYFAGLIDEVRIYNRALSGSEILVDMNSPVLPPVVLPGDYNSDEIVDLADYVVWRKYTGTTIALPNDTTPGSVTSADYDVWAANMGASGGGQGQQTAGSASMPLAANASARTTGAAVELVLPHRRQRKPSRTFEPRDHALSRASSDLLLLERLRTSLETVDGGSTSRAAAVDRSEKPQVLADVTFLKALDKVFAELGQVWKSRPGAR